MSVEQMTVIRLTPSQAQVLRDLVATGMGLYLSEMQQMHRSPEYRSVMGESVAELGDAIHQGANIMSQIQRKKLESIG